MGSDSVEKRLKSTSALIGASVPMERVFRLIHQVSGYGYTVLVAGERGTGRKLVARTVHEMGPRKDRPFVTLDCSTLAPTFLRAELFGYARGAFLGASENRWGLVALAGPGTLFLDHVEHIPSSLQLELVRALQTAKFTPLGSTYPLPFKARVLAGTSVDLASKVKAGAFREDFYMALNVRQIHLPPLRERKEDISLLAAHFIEKYGKSEQPGMILSDSARRFLEAYAWPQNVRELEGTIKRAVESAEGSLLRLRDVRLALRDESIVSMGIATEGLPQDEIERQAIVRALRDTGGDTTAAAHLLGMGRAALSKRLRYHGLSRNPS